MPALAPCTETSTALLAEHYPLARAIARRTHARLPKGVDLDDLVSVAVIGLMEAVARFDPRRGVSFKSFAKHRIQGAILDALRANDWVPRSVRRRVEEVESTAARLREELGRLPSATEIAERLEMDVGSVQSARDADMRPILSLDVAVSEDGESTLADAVASPDRPDQLAEESQLRGAMVDAVGRLPERERAAIVLFYFRELSLKEIGAVLGVSESRACQLCGQGAKRLRAALAPMVA